MNQNCSDLMAALKKQGGIEFIKAANMQEATDSIEAKMGKAWASARGRRHVVHQLLESCFIPVTRYTIKRAEEVTYVDTYASKVDDVYYDADGNILEPVMGYRLLTEAERHDRMSRASLKKLRRQAERGKPRHHRRGSRRLASTAPITVIDGTSKVKEPRFSAFLTPKKIRKFGIGDLSVG